MNFARQGHWNHNVVLPRDLRQVFGRFIGTEGSDTSQVARRSWAPRVDIREEEKRFVILADVPGVDPAAIEINMDKGILSIKGERASEVLEGSTLTRVERSQGAFDRRFALPDSADAESISASGRNGVLEISIPKKPETTPRRITINA